MADPGCLCVVCDEELWRAAAPLVELALDWSHAREWERQQAPFARSGQRSLVVADVSGRLPPGWSIKVKGHHFGLFEDTGATMVFRYGPLYRPMFTSYVAAGRTGPVLPSGIHVNAAGHGSRVGLSRDRQFVMHERRAHAPAGAMLLEGAARELRMVGEARNRGLSPFAAVAYGRYPDTFEGKLTGFNVIAGPFGADVRANGLFKGLVMDAGRERFLLPIPCMRSALAGFLGVAPGSVQVLDRGDAPAIRRLWTAVAAGVGVLLRRTHRSGLVHGAPDFGNVVVIDVGRGSVQVAFTDWESSTLRSRFRTPWGWRRRCCEDLLAVAHFLALEERHNPFFAAVTRAGHLFAKVLAAYVDRTVPVAEAARAVVARIPSTRHREGAGAWNDRSTGHRLDHIVESVGAA